MKSFTYFNKIVKIIFNTVRMMQFYRISIPTNGRHTSFHSCHIFRGSRKGIKSHSKFIIIPNISCSFSPMSLSRLIPLGIMATTIVYQNTYVTNKVSMAIFNFKVEDLNGFIKLKKAYALNGCRVPVFGVDNVVRCKIRRINPAFAFYLERMCFGTLYDLAVNIKLNQSVYLVDGCRYNFLFGCFACNVVNAGNCIADLDGSNSLIIQQIPLFVKKKTALGGIPKNSLKCGEK